MYKKQSCGALTSHKKYLLCTLLGNDFKNSLVAWKEKNKQEKKYRQNKIKKEMKRHQSPFYYLREIILLHIIFFLISAFGASESHTLHMKEKPADRTIQKQEQKKAEIYEL